MKNKDLLYYDGARFDLLPHIPNNAKNILDIGCGTGATGLAIKSKLNNNIEVIGVELNAEAGELAKDKIDQIIIGNIEEVNLSFAPGYFDCILYADILEHLIDPWKVLANHKYLLANDGCIIASIPNIANYKIIRMLKKGLWEYKNAGIMDRTHLRFFTKKTISEMFITSGYNPEIVDKILSKNNFWLLMHKLFNSDKCVIQFIIKATKKVN